MKAETRTLLDSGRYRSMLNTYGTLLASAVERFAIYIGSLMMLSSSGSNPALASDPLAGYLWRSRVVVIFAPGPDDKPLTEQKHIISRMGSGAAERDLAILEILGSTPEAHTMRRRLGTPGSGFQVVLVGKDGGVKLRSAQPLAADKLMNTIDAMPMRRQEMQRG